MIVFDLLGIAVLTILSTVGFDMGQLWYLAEVTEVLYLAPPTCGVGRAERGLIDSC